MKRHGEFPQVVAVREDEAAVTGHVLSPPGHDLIPVREKEVHGLDPTADGADLAGGEPGCIAGDRAGGWSFGNSA